MLYLVPTPLGNLKDFTYRAVEVLQSVEVILCEDTRTSSKLLNHYANVDVNNSLCYKILGILGRGSYEFFRDCGGRNRDAVEQQPRVRGWSQWTTAPDTFLHRHMP